jgi:TetR/AcrR family transcriptional regulator, transcriptional repressor of bet genes
LNVHSENNSSIQNMPKRSFIEEARRVQIVSAAIETLVELGYAKTSLAQIAKRAGISTSLIPYHFKDKEDLLEQTLFEITGTWLMYVQEKVAGGTSATDKLRIYIEANLAFMGTRPKNFWAFVEIVFNARNAEGKLRYLNDDAEDPNVLQLKNVLIEGQQNGEFRQFDVDSMAVAIRATIDQFIGQIGRRSTFSLETYTSEIIELFVLATKKLPQ